MSRPGALVAAAVLLAMCAGCGSARGTSTNQAPSTIASPVSAPATAATTPVAGGSPSVSATPPPLTSPTPTPRPSSVPEPHIARVVAAGGQRQWIECRGSGSPTVVVVSGLGATTAMWSAVLPRFQAMSRTCVYDRPGLGRSPARVGPTRIDAGTHARELRALLLAVGDRGPYLLVGHSYGGLVVRAFARAYPTTVTGVLLAEGVYPGIQADYWAPYRHDWHEGGTTIDMAASARADGDGPHLGSTPLVVITAADPEPGAPAWVVALWDLRQRQAAALSTDSVHVLAVHSGHVVQQDQPAVVVEAVRELVTAVRTWCPAAPLRPGLGGCRRPLSVIIRSLSGDIAGQTDGVVEISCRDNDFRVTRAT